MIPSGRPAPDDDPRQVHLTPEFERMRSAIADFLIDVHSIYGMYWDAWCGFAFNVRMMNEAQAQTRPTLPAGRDPDALPIFIGNVDPSKGTPQHAVSQGGYKRRNARGGENDILLAQMVLAFVYELWESEHRHKVAKAIGIKADEIKIPAFGDLRWLRHLVMHNRGVITADVLRKLEVLKIGAVGTRLVMNDAQMDAVVRALMDGISEWAFGRFGVNPAGAETPPA